MRWQPKERCGKGLRGGRECGRPDGHNGQHYSKEAISARCAFTGAWFHTEPGIVVRMLRTARDRAQRDGVPFEMQASDIAIPRSCPVCGRELQVGDGKPCNSSPTLDKNAPALGYVKGNVLVICFDCNRRKRDMSWAELRAFAEAGERALLAHNEGVIKRA